jgi:hypothetical protein
MADLKKQAAKPATVKKWETMDGSERAIFLAKVCVMVCTCGFVFGGVLVEGMDYDKV